MNSKIIIYLPKIEQVIILTIIKALVVAQFLLGKIANKDLLRIMLQILQHHSAKHHFTKES
jgi:hypothetical protein